MLSQVSISQYLGVSPGDAAVCVAAAAADLRPLHAPRLTHPHPHQVSLRAVELPTGLRKISQCLDKIPSTSVRKDHNQCVVCLEKIPKAACPPPPIGYDQCINVLCGQPL